MAFTKMEYFTFYCISFVRKFCLYLNTGLASKVLEADYVQISCAEVRNTLFKSFCRNKSLNNVNECSRVNFKSPFLFYWYRILKLRLLHVLNNLKS